MVKRTTLYIYPNRNMVNSATERESRCNNSSRWRQINGYEYCTPSGRLNAIRIGVLGPNRSLWFCVRLSYRMVSPECASRLMTCLTECAAHAYEQWNRLRIRCSVLRICCISTSECVCFVYS